MVLDIKEMGKRIAAARKARGLTQESLAEKLDCTSKHISFVERGVSLLSLEKLIDLCSLFDCSLDYLVFGENREIVMSQMPTFVIDIIESDDEKEKELFLSYLAQYKMLRSS